MVKLSNSTRSTTSKCHVFKWVKNLLMLDFHQSWAIVALAIGIISGVVLAMVFRINFFASWWWIVLVIIILVFTYLRPKFLLLALSLIAGMILSFYRVTSELHNENYIRQFYDQTVVIIGTVDGDPETDVGSTKFKITNLKFGNFGASIVGGSIYVSLSSNSTIERSDIVTLEGKLLAGFGTYSGHLYRPKVSSIMRPDPPDPVLATRNWFAARIASLLPDTESKLGLSYLLGMKSGLPDDLNENLRTVGLVHIVVASGAHLSILVEIAKKIFGKISRTVGVIFSISFVVFFMSMVGFTPSIMRAGIMCVLTTLMWWMGRKFAPWRIILLVAALTLMINPMYIINLGWLLSFASFTGIMIIGPKLTKFFYGARRPGFIAGMVITTIAATMVTLPITLYYYGQISLISVIANLLILPTLSYAMGLVFLTGVVSGLPGVETLIAFVTTKLLDFHIAVVEFFGSIKQFLITIDPYHSWVFWLYCVIIIPLLGGLLYQKMVKSREVSKNKLE